MSAGTALLAAAIAIAVLMVVTWAISLAVGDASIVDVVWGLGFVVVAWTVRLQGDTNELRQWLLVALVTIWGVRLATYLFWRNHGRPEDYRYRAMRKRWGSRFWLVSLVVVFALQGALMWVVSLGVQLGQVPESPDVGIVGVLGVVVWAVGFGFESIGDWQLARFKADPTNEGRVLDSGLWRYTRHPNYFGDCVVWWGIGLVAAESGMGAWGLLGSAVMTVLLLRVSGVALLERSLRKRKPEYQAYVERTSAFVPMPPSRSDRGS